ncbi:MAG: hypothetical protein GC154_20345 [bacterium]|nr:hypothetical protein [bacterium]
MNEQQREFSYEDIWALEERTLQPHQRRAYDLGTRIDQLPVNSALTPYHAALNRIETLYNPNELRLEGFDVAAMLRTKTETEVLRELEDAGMELAVSAVEIERQLYVMDHGKLLSLPKPKTPYFIRPAPPDESAPFESIDFEREFGPRFNREELDAWDELVERGEASKRGLQA